MEKSDQKRQGRSVCLEQLKARRCKEDTRTSAPAGPACGAGAVVPTCSASCCPCTVAPRAARSLALESTLFHLRSQANEQHRPNSQAGVFRKTLLFLSIQGTASSLSMKTSPV